MRIIGGRVRGRTLRAPETRAIRPTTDRLRETLFNILSHAHGDPVPGARVIDLFAGTGALGLEALSRGAAHALFVETDPTARALIRDNVEMLGFGGVRRIFRRDASTRIGCAYADPFAALRDGGWLEPAALCVVEEHDAVDVAPPSGFVPLDRRSAGDSQLLFLRYAPTGTAA